jgi:cell division GTPase FtsZ
MAEQVRIVFNSDGFAQILNSDGCQQLVQGIAEEITERANANAGLDSFKASTVKAGTRWIGFASSTDKASSAAESEDKALTGAIYG